MKIKTSELTGAALDWAVAECAGVKTFTLGGRIFDPTTSDELGTEFKPSTDWSQGGPLIAQHIFLLEDLGDYEWEATAANGGKCRGDTVLQAVCRAYVASHLGDEVEVPEELSCV